MGLGWPWSVASLSVSVQYNGKGWLAKSAWPAGAGVRRRGYSRLRARTVNRGGKGPVEEVAGLGCDVIGELD